MKLNSILQLNRRELLPHTCQIINQMTSNKSSEEFENFKGKKKAMKIE